MKNQQDLLIDSAYHELLAIRAANGGNKRYNDIKTVVDRANRRGLGTVDRWHIEYRIQQGKLGKSVKSSTSLDGKNSPVQTVLFDETEAYIASPITQQYDENTNSETTIVVEEDESNERRGGRIKGKTNKKSWNTTRNTTKHLLMQPAVVLMPNNPPKVMVLS